MRENAPAPDGGRKGRVNSARYIASIAIIAAGTLVFAACSATSPAPDTQLSGTVNGAGATSQGGAQEAWIASFQEVNSAATINYEPSGSGAGREMFISGGADFAGSDAPLSDSNLTGSFASCMPGTKAIDLPVYVSPIAVAFHVAGITSLNLDASVLARIFSGSITTWDDPAIAELNPGAALPNATITAVHRSDNSGTTKNFADYLHTIAPSDWQPSPVDAFPFLIGEGAQGTSGVVDAITKGVNTIGYVDASRTTGLGVAQIKVGDTFVAPSPQRAAATLEASPQLPNREPNDVALKIIRTSTDPNTYPLVLVSYVVACQKYKNAKKGELVKAYLGSIVSQQGQEVATNATGSTPLPPTLSTQLVSVVGTIS